MAILQLLHSWVDWTWCICKELQSLIGSIHHVCNVIPPGKVFLRSMINLLSAFQSDFYLIRLKAKFRGDLTWWLEYLLSWDGISVFQITSLSPLSDLFATSHAASSLGSTATVFGKIPGVWGRGQITSSTVKE